MGKLPLNPILVNQLTEEQVWQQENWRQLYADLVQASKQIYIVEDESHQLLGMGVWVDDIQLLLKRTEWQDFVLLDRHPGWVLIPWLGEKKVRIRRNYRSE